MRTPVREKIILFIKILIQRFIAADVSNYSLIVAYYLLLSLFPLLILIGNVLPYIHISPDAIYPYVESLLPENVYSFLKPAITSLLTNNSGRLLSISLLGTLWSASQGVNAIQKSLNKVYEVKNRKNYVIMRLISVWTVSALVLLFILLAAFFSVGQVIVKHLRRAALIHFSADLFESLFSWRWPVIFLVLMLIFILLYKFVPNKKISLKHALPGTLFAVSGWLILAKGFEWYAAIFERSVSGYQIIGSFIVLMIWLSFAATIVILGGVLNATLEQYAAENGKREGRA